MPLERDDGKVAAIEVKAGSRAPRAGLDAIMKLRRRLGSQFLAGVVLYTGARAYTVDDRIHIVPLSRLWQMSR